MPPIWRDARGGAAYRDAAPRPALSPPVPLLSCGEVKPECIPSRPSCSTSEASPSLSSSSSALCSATVTAPCASPAGFAACDAAAPSPPPALPDISMRRMRRSPPPRVKTVASPWRNLSIAAWAQSCLTGGAPTSTTPRDLLHRVTGVRVMCPCCKVYASQWLRPKKLRIF